MRKYWTILLIIINKRSAKFSIWNSSFLTKGNIGVDYKSTNEGERKGYQTTNYNNELNNIPLFPPIEVATCHPNSSKHIPHHN